MEPPFLAIELRKLLLWLTLECFRRKFVRKQIDWTSRAGSLSQKRSKWAFYPKVGVASKFRARFECKSVATRTPLLEILDPPLILQEARTVVPHIMHVVHMMPGRKWVYWPVIITIAAIYCLCHNLFNIT